MQSDTWWPIHVLNQTIFSLPYRHGHDNVAIGGLQLENNYALDFHPESGIYHLRISNATYDRDNGQFECRMKEGKTGKILHTKSFDLTVLLKVCIYK